MTIHRVSDTEAFWYGLNPLKRTVRTYCGLILENATEVSDSQVNCPECNSASSDVGLILGIF